MPGKQADHAVEGVKFDATGQNTLGQGILVQIVDGKYNTVWPFAWPRAK